MRRLIIALLLLAGTAEAAEFANPETPLAEGRVGYVARNGRAFEANLRLPAERPAKVPLVVMLHGTAGIDGRGTAYAEALAASGIASLEVDVHGAFGRPNGQPGNRSTTDEFIQAAVVALNVARRRPDVDGERIGLMGFSAGGHAALVLANAAIAAAKGDARFAAYLPLYPACYKLFERGRSMAWNGTLAGPVHIVTGALDGYDVEPGTCGALAALLGDDSARLSVTVLPDAHHGFDGTADRVINDPAANRGQGGPVRLAPNPEAAARARQVAVEFFEKTLR